MGKSEIARRWDSIPKD